MMCEFPVLITGTMQYLVWVEAESPQDAHDSIQDTPYEWVDNDTKPIEAWLDAETDPEETYRAIEFHLPEHDAHVNAHRFEMARQKREAEKAACTAAGHPDTEKPLSDGRTWCNGCFLYLPAPVKAGGQS